MTAGLPPDEIAARVGTLLRRARDARFFSGAAWSCGTAEGEVAGGLVGTVSWDGPPVDRDSWWDLASVTKPVVGLAVMSLVESGELTLDDTVGSHLPVFAGSDKESLTVRDLLTHTSGMPGPVPLYRWCATGEHMLAAIRDIPVVCPPGTRVIYSSPGFILLGLIAEAAAGADLATIVRTRVTSPAAMDRTVFALSPDQRAHSVATEDCPWRGRVVQGTVHDENAEVFGRPAGHAGLFAPVADMAALAQALCRDGVGSRGRILTAAGLREMTRPRTDHLPLRRALAWQGRDGAESPAGDLAGPRTFGHTGFTGTSVFIDPDSAAYVVLLTNRVHPTRHLEGFGRVRQQVHNIAFAGMGR
ncbi:serine hydrolase [Streptomyces sp. ME03-5709C]|nr:serine hydrolase [Streptomyces sp. ME03-5709C]